MNELGLFIEVPTVAMLLYLDECDDVFGDGLPLLQPHLVLQVGPTQYSVLSTYTVQCTIIYIYYKQCIAQKTILNSTVYIV